MFAKTERTVVRETVLDFFSFMVYIVIFVHSFLSDTDLFKTECGTLDGRFKNTKYALNSFFVLFIYIYLIKGSLLLFLDLT